MCPGPKHLNIWDFTWPEEFPSLLISIRLTQKLRDSTMMKYSNTLPWDGHLLLCSCWPSFPTLNEIKNLPEKQLQVCQFKLTIRNGLLWACSLGTQGSGISPFLSPSSGKLKAITSRKITLPFPELTVSSPGPFISPCFPVRTMVIFLLSHCGLSVISILSS